MLCLPFCLNSICKFVFNLQLFQSHKLKDYAYFQICIYLGKIRILNYLHLEKEKDGRKGKKKGNSFKDTFDNTFTAWGSKVAKSLLAGTFQIQPRWLSSKESVCQAGDTGSVSGLGGYSGRGNGNPLQNSFFFFNWRLITLQYCGGFCHTFMWISLGNPVDRGAW